MRYNLFRQTSMNAGFFKKKMLVFILRCSNQRANSFVNFWTSVRFVREILLKPGSNRVRYVFFTTKPIRTELIDSNPIFLDSNCFSFQTLFMTTRIIEFSSNRTRKTKLDSFELELLSSVRTELGKLSSVRTELGNSNSVKRIRKKK